MLTQMETSFIRLDARIEREVHLTRGIVALPCEPPVGDREKARLSDFHVVARALNDGYPMPARSLLKSGTINLTPQFASTNMAPSVSHSGFS